MNRFLKRVITTVIALTLVPVLTTEEVVSQIYSDRAHGSKGSERIIGGEEVETNAKGAWTAVLLLDGDFYCGGSMVAPENLGSTKSVNWVRGKENPRWVITAAHCLYDRSGQRVSPDRLQVLTGSLDRFNEFGKGKNNGEVKGEKLKVLHVMEHEGFDRKTLTNDIALLYIEQTKNPKMSSRRRHSIGLPEREEISWAYAPYTQMHVQGWGATQNSSSNRYLFEVRVPMVDLDTCSENYNLRGRQLTPGMVCAGYSRGQYDSCSGDSGGPLVYRPRENPRPQNTLLTGVVSWGIGCALPDLAGVYASTTFYRSWLDQAFRVCKKTLEASDCTRRAVGRSLVMENRSAPNMITGVLHLNPEGCEKEDLCRLGEPLRFVQANGTAWQSDAWSSNEVQSGTTDGASIPNWAQPIIGKPFDRSYLKAAILHDHYCYRENHVRNWRSTHRMFRDALLASGLSRFKANVMYYAVMLGGPRWSKLVPGEQCGPQCVKTVGRAGKGKAGDWQDDLYALPAFAEAVKRFHDPENDLIHDDAALIAQAESDRIRLLARK